MYTGEKDEYVGNHHNISKNVNNLVKIITTRSLTFRKE